MKPAAPKPLVNAKGSTDVVHLAGLTFQSHLIMLGLTQMARLKRLFQWSETLHCLFITESPKRNKSQKKDKQKHNFQSQNFFLVEKNPLANNDLTPLNPPASISRCIRPSEWSPAIDKWIHQQPGWTKPTEIGWNFEKFQMNSQLHRQISIKHGF